MGADIVRVGSVSALLVAEEARLLRTEEAILALAPARECFSPNEAELPGSDELVKFLTIALLVSVLVVDATHGSDEMTAGLQGCVDVIHS